MNLQAIKNFFSISGHPWYAAEPFKKHDPEMI
jgi:hypothetical protein